MRLHSLRLRALGPFAAEQSIDFEQLGAGGLFLLDGPTGAGKSTVLDAITFALYGPGERGGDGRLHSHFAAAGVPPEVALEFSVRGVRQRVTRSPEFARPKRRGEGMTVEAARVHLERLEHGRWVSRSSNKAEVGDLIADGIGLSRDQFTQVVLLPQGEFMKFLRAGDDDRRVLLTRLFGAQLYERITDELERRRKVVSGGLDEASRRVRSRVSATAEAAGLGPDQQDELGALCAADQALRFAEIEKELATTASLTASAAAEAADNLTALRESSQRAASDAARWQRFATALRALAAHEAGRAEFDEASRLIALADRAAPVRPLLEALDDAAREAELAASALPAVVASAALLDEQARACRREAGELTPLVRREEEAAQLRATAHQAHAEAEAAAAELARLDERQARLPALQAAAEQAVRGAEARLAGEPALTARRDELRRRLDATAELARLAPRHAAALDSRAAALAAYEQAAQEHLRLGAKRLANIAGELAAGLVDGSPCDVCGSRDHPQPAAQAPDAVSAQDVTQALEHARQLKLVHDQAVAEFTELDQHIAVLAAVVDGAAREQLAEQLDTAEAELMAARTAADALPGLCAERDTLAVEAGHVSDAALAATSAHAAAMARYETATHAAAALAEELAVAAGEYPSVSARLAALEASAASAAELSAKAAARDRAAAALHAARERALSEARTAGFASLDEVRAALRVAAGADGLRDRARTWAERAAALRGAVQSVEFDDLRPHDPSADDLPADDLEADDLEAAASVHADQAHRVAQQLAADVAAAEVVARSAAVAAERASAIAARYAAARDEVAAAQREYDELAAAAEPVIHLAKLARGMSGNRRVTLTTYVLRQWFEQVVAAANVRLAGMSSGRFELIRVDDTGKSERTGLTLNVLDRHTGEQRSPRSLSGGETFYTSLALALGLADVVRAEAGGVELDTLFIDEGFGSLDADTLDQVMEVIDELRTRGRTVGIVSHVAELKHRISERVEVRRLPDGSSTLRVVA